MMLLLIGVGLALIYLALVVSSRMTKATPAMHRVSAAVAGGTGALLIASCTVLVELLPASLALLVACAAWFAFAPPPELAPAPKRRAGPWWREDA